MISFIVQLASRFERKHGVRPNLLYINYEHFQQLKDTFGETQEADAMLRRLDMELILSRDVIHPRVAWSPVRAHAV